MRSIFWETSIPSAWRKALAAVLVAGLAACGTGDESTSRALVLQHAIVIDGTGGPVITDATIVVEDGRIAALGPDSEIAVPRHAEVVNAAGQYVIPGLWDMHTHLSKARASALGLFVAHGVTGIRDMGGDHQELLRWRAEIDAGDRVGPRIVMAGPYLESSENVERMRNTPLEEMVEPVERTRVPVATPEEADRVVDSLAALGVDFLKIRTVTSPETYFAIARAADRVGLDLVGHTFGVAIEDVIESGQRGIEHVFFPPLDDRTEAERRAIFRRLAGNGAGIVPTLINFTYSAFAPDSLVQAVVDDSLGVLEPRRAYLSRYLIEDWREQMAERDPALRALIEAVYTSSVRDLRAMGEEGVRIMPGTDTAILMIFPGSSLHDELALFVSELGMTPMEALESATRTPTEFLGLSDSLGTLQPGKIADFVVLSADPLANITNTKRVTGVALRGQWFDHQDIERLLRQVKEAEDLRANDWPRATAGG